MSSSSFQIKDFASIVAAEINQMSATQTAITDYNIGSVARTLIEAPAIEMDELYQQMLNGLTQAIPVSVFNSFNFNPLAQVASSGIETFYADPVLTADLLIPAGTAVQVPNGSIQYITQVDATLPAGEASVGVAVTANTAGYASNAVAGSISDLIDNLPGITSVSNLVDFTNGRDVETDDERKVRFQGYISTLARAINTAIVYGATSAFLTDSNNQVIETVVTAIDVEPYKTDNTQPVGLVNVYIYNGSTGASADLVARAQQIIDGYYLDDGTPVPGYKAAGVIVVVAAATLLNVAVTGVITLAAGAVGADVIAAATTAIENYLQALPIGQPALKAELIAIVMGIEGVYNFTMSAPTVDTVITSPQQKVVPGTMTLTTG